MGYWMLFFFFHTIKWNLQNRVDVLMDNPSSTKKIFVVV
jgi:hypothetical protein